jgi:hypothetical protein
MSERQRDRPASNDSGRQLVAYLNADAQRLKVSLLMKGASKPLNSTCHAGPNAVKISFSSSCTFDTPPPGEYDLSVQVQERFTPHESHFTVSIR